jgi:hypothetical protein
MTNAGQANNAKSNKYFLVAFGLINILGITLLLCALSLLAGFTIGRWEFPLAFISALGINYYAIKFFISENATRFFFKSSAAIVAIVIGSIIFSGFFYDVSFDGQWYHQETVIRLKQGYNPMYQELPIPADEQIITANNWCYDAKQETSNFKIDAPRANLKFISINYSSKGTEIIAGAIYLLTNRVETSKGVNTIMLFASFFLCLSLLYKIDRIGLAAKWLLAFVLSFNPITVKEMLSFCVDGFGASLLLCILITFCLLLIAENRYYLLLLGVIIILTVNIKFTTLVFAGVYGIGFLLFLLIYKKIATFKKVLVTGIIAAITGIFCCGFNPYVTNTIHRHDIFYGLKDTRTEIKRMTPTPFLNLNRIENLFLSISAHQGWDLANGSDVSQIPKIPFYLSKSDIVESTDVEPSISGFGPFFSGTLLIALVIFVIISIKSRKTQPFKYGIAGLLIIVTTIVIMPDSWWSRFIPQLWLLPVIILVMATFTTFRGGKLLKTVLYLSLILNIAWSALIFVFLSINASRVNYQMAQLKALKQPVTLEFCSYRSFKSNMVRFTEAGIPVTTKAVGAKHAYDVIYSTTKIETILPLPELPKPFILAHSKMIEGTY